MGEISQEELAEYYKSYCRKREAEDKSVPCSFRQYLRASVYIDKAMKNGQEANGEDMDRFIPKRCEAHLIFGETDTISVNRFLKANLQEASRLMESPFVYFVHQQGKQMSNVLLSRVNNGRIMNNSLMYITVELNDSNVTDVLERTADGRGYIQTAGRTIIKFRDIRYSDHVKILVSEFPFVFPSSMVKEVRMAGSGNADIAVAGITDEEPEVILESAKNLKKILKSCYSLKERK